VAGSAPAEPTAFDVCVMVKSSAPGVAGIAG
jgi:hypothetical protein